MRIRGRSFLSALLLILCACSQPNAGNALPPDSVRTETPAVTDNAIIERAFAEKRSDVQVGGKGFVTKLLVDDNKGSRHQRFLVKINTQQTLLFAHNLDLAPRVPIQVGDEISFYGEYIYNPKGGIVHWTHHAPQGDHIDGWIIHNGEKYQ